MGASVLADGLAKSPEVGLFSGLIVSSMLGATISFSLPYAMEVADKRHHKNILFGFLCGIVTVPVGCFVGGLMVGVPCSGGWTNSLFPCKIPKRHDQSL